MSRFTLAQRTPPCWHPSLKPGRIVLTAATWNILEGDEVIAILLRRDGGWEAVNPQDFVTIGHPHDTRKGAFNSYVEGRTGARIPRTDTGR